MLSNILRSNQVGAAISRTSAWNSRVFLTAAPRSIQASSHPEGSGITETVNQGVNEAIKTGETMKDRSFSTAQQVTQKTKSTANKVSETAQDVTEKAKQTAENAWDSAKETAQKAKDTVLGKAEETKEFVKENAEAVTKSMNTKN